MSFCDEYHPDLDNTNREQFHFWGSENIIIRILKFSGRRVQRTMDAQSDIAS